jgi:hypothetical protein
VIPLRLQRFAAFGLPRAPVPVSRVRKVSLFAMQIRVYPCSRRTLYVLRDFVSGVPVTLGVVPQGPQARGQCGWNLRL